MAMISDFDLKTLVCDNSSFGPDEVLQISSAINNDFSQFGILRDAVNELENKIDDLSQQCCLASYEVEDTLHDLQLCIDKIKTYVENKNE